MVTGLRWWSLCSAYRCWITVLYTQNLNNEKEEKTAEIAFSLCYAQSKGHVKTQWEGSRLQTRKRGLTRSHPAGTLILDFQAPELWEKKCRLLQATQSMESCYGSLSWLMQSPPVCIFNKQPRCWDLPKNTTSKYSVMGTQNERWWLHFLGDLCALWRWRTIIPGELKATPAPQILPQPPYSITPRRKSFMESVIK